MASELAGSTAQIVCPDGFRRSYLSLIKWLRPGRPELELHPWTGQRRCLAFL